MNTYGQERTLKRRHKLGGFERLTDIIFDCI